VPALFLLPLAATLATSSTLPENANKEMPNAETSPPMAQAAVLAAGTQL